MHTTVVEVDPAVYKFARKYFELSEPDEVYIEDARSWVHERAITHASGNGELSQKFDYVVHDCFSGGGVPQHLFTEEFWGELKETMDITGILAVVSELADLFWIGLDLAEHFVSTRILWEGSHLRQPERS